MGTPDSLEKATILFDGICNLCNHSVQFIIKRDKKNHFLFAALQSNFGQEQLTRFDISTQGVESIVLIYKDRVYQRSDAVLEISRHLGGLWPLCYGFKILPPFLRDAAYNLIARHRYKWFGRKDECMIPTPDLKMKFLN